MAKNVCGFFHSDQNMLVLRISKIIFRTTEMKTVIRIAGKIRLSTEWEIDINTNKPLKLTYHNVIRRTQYYFKSDGKFCASDRMKYAELFRIYFNYTTSGK